MSVTLLARADAATVPLTPIATADFEPWRRRTSARVGQWVRDVGFTAAPGTLTLVPSADGTLGRVLLGVGADDFWAYGGLPFGLPKGSYRIEGELDPEAVNRAALGWLLGSYRFTRYRKPRREPARLVWPERADRAAVARAAEGVFLVRDLVNTPAGDMGPAELAAHARDIARRHGARCTITVGDKLLAANYPAIHAVGRASVRAPRLIDLAWGKGGPRITLIGKGVCFDTGGLDLKTSGGMKLMKKDMGGAAHVLALAQMVMSAKLKVRLRVLVPAVENSVSGDAYRPLDVLATRKGLTVEVGNTDAEGRLILADALAEAARDKPDLIVDCATLTGAARVALGPDLPALFCNDDGLADALLAHGKRERDPLWRLPLHADYRSGLDSKVADLNNISESPYGGAIIAALFLQEFVEAGTPWAHIDMMAWNLRDRPGRPEGGEAVGLRALFALIAERAGEKADVNSRRRGQPR